MNTTRSIHRSKTELKNLYYQNNTYLIKENSTQVVEVIYFGQPHVKNWKDEVMIQKDSSMYITSDVLDQLEWQRHGIGVIHFIRGDSFRNIDNGVDEIHSIHINFKK